MVRTASRSRELAVRMALGALPLALGRQLLWETLILAVGATAAAIAIGQALLPALVSLFPADIPRIGDAAVDALAAGGRVIAAGALLGLVVAAAVGRLMAAILFEVTSWDPVALVVTPALFAAVALAACAVPALRAARLEPADCLRAE